MKGIDGSPGGNLGCLIDITDRKRKEDLGRQRAEEAEQRHAEAVEARTRQEELMDITSHEFRNPISSLMQCASMVKSNLVTVREQLRRLFEEGKTYTPTAQVLRTLDEDIEALDNIYSCGLTQERISNDVLSLSKIQLGQLDIFDVATNISAEATKLVSVFQGEACVSGITLSLHVADTLKRLGDIMIDPVRFGQM